MFYAHAPQVTGSAAITAYQATCIAARIPSDVVHIHAEGQCMFLPILKRAGKKIVVTVHGLDWQREKWDRAGKTAILFGEQMAAKYADEIIVLSKENQYYFRDVYGRRTVLIENGVSIPDADQRSDVEKRYGLEPGKYFLFLGRFAPEKRPDMAVAAFKGLSTGLKLVMAGPDADIDHDAEWYKEAVTNPRIIMSGFMQGNDMAWLYENCRAFILPSDIEGMSLSLLEAMAYGCRCITSDIYENTSVLGRFGNTFQAGNTAALKKEMETAAKEPFFKNLKQASYIRSRCQWDRTAKLTEEVLLDVSKRT